MKILGFNFTKGAETGDSHKFSFTGELVRADLESFDRVQEIANTVTQSIAKELTPIIKEKLMEHSGFEKIINEIRLLVAKEFLK